MTETKGWAVMNVRTGKINYGTFTRTKKDAGEGYRYMIEIGACRVVPVVIRRADRKISNKSRMPRP